MNKDYPDRPTVKEESKTLKTREEQETPDVSKEYGWLRGIKDETIGFIICFVLILILYPILYPFYQDWQEHKEDKTRETMIEWIDKIDLATQEDITTLNLEPYILPEEDAWGNNIEVTCTTKENTYTIAMRSPGDEDIILDDVYERLTRNTKTNEVTRSQSEWTDIINSVEVITEEKTEPEIKEPIEEPLPTTANDQPKEAPQPTKETEPKEVPQPDTEDTPRILSSAKEKAEKVGNVVKNKAQDAKRNIKKFIDKNKPSNDSSKEE